MSIAKIALISRNNPLEALSRGVEGSSCSSAARRSFRAALWQMRIFQMIVQS